MTRRFQYVIARYVPNVIRDEAVNVGVIVREVGGDSHSFKFLPRSATVRKLWPTADQKLVAHFHRQLEQAKRAAIGPSLFGDDMAGGNVPPLDQRFFTWAQRELNGNLQVTEPRGITATDVASALTFLYREYVALPQGSSRPINYQAMAPFASRQRLWATFEKRNLVRPGLLIREMTLPGKHAPWTFDLGHRNGQLRIINSLALNTLAPETNLGRALILKGMLEDVEATAGQEVNATAVVDLGRDEKRIPAAKEAKGILLDAKIEVVRSGEVTRLAERVQMELGLPR